MYEDNNDNDDQHSEDVAETMDSEDTTDLEIDQTYNSNTSDSDDLVHFIVQQQCQISQIVLSAILSITKAIM
ncbi:hypothetical protein PAXRUDRAFT_38066, partial [Paxillus rubicundulus Ve08.2h10]